MVDCGGKTSSSHCCCVPAALPACWAGPRSAQLRRRACRRAGHCALKSHLKLFNYLHAERVIRTKSKTKLCSFIDLGRSSLWLGPAAPAAQAATRRHLGSGSGSGWAERAALAIALLRRDRFIVYTTLIPMLRTLCRSSFPLALTLATVPIAILAMGAVAPTRRLRLDVVAT